jgi:hypothetical protein
VRSTLVLGREGVALVLEVLGEEGMSAGSEGIKTEAPEVCGTLCARSGKANLARENNFGSDRMGVKDQPSQAKFISGLWENVKYAFYIRTVGRRRCEEWDVCYVRSGAAFMSSGTLAL